MTESHDVLFSELPGQDGNIGLITLNRPSVLNAINHHMVQALFSQLKQWKDNQQIKAVVIRAAEGRAFCAGGDLRATYHRALEHAPSMAEFFHEEYQLNRCIFHYPKPYIALLDGITMGGGVGISINGSHRVGTDNLLFAMPETGIGFFPDIGGTYFLPRLPGFTGFYLGLTGARIKVEDCLSLGLVQQKVQSIALPNLLDALAEESFGKNAHEGVTHIINQFQSPVSSSSLDEHRTVIDECFSAATMEEVMHALENHSSSFINDTLLALSKKSPTSLKVSLRALQLGKQLEFDECMQQEFRLATRFLLGHDFLEGIRAVIIDKDQTPQWQPKSLDAIKNTDVNAYFAPLEKELI